MESIRFSIHIPVYNVEKYLVECVESVLNQSFDNYEIILTDDGSTDKSGGICDSFSDDRIRVFHNDNQGLLLSRSFSISKAKGEYSVFLDSDDYLESGFLERINSVIEEESCDIVSFSYQRVYSSRTEKPELPWSINKVFENETLDEYRKEILFNNSMNSLCTKVIKTSLLQSDMTTFENFCVSSGEDLLRSLYPVFNANKIVFLPEHWYNYRFNEASITQKANPERYKSILAVRKRAYEYFSKSSFFNEENCRKFATRFIVSLMGSVMDIANSDYSTSKKISAFKAIVSDEFYLKSRLKCNTEYMNIKTKTVYALFSAKMYKLIIALARVLL